MLSLLLVQGYHGRRNQHNTTNAFHLHNCISFFLGCLISPAKKRRRPAWAHICAHFWAHTCANFWAYTCAHFWAHICAHFGPNTCAHF